MDEAASTPPTFRLSFSDQIHCVESSCYEWSQQLICIGLTEEVVVATLKFQEEDDSVEDIAYEAIRAFHHEARPHCIAWSPDTSLSVVPRVLAFCVAGADFKIRLYNSNLNDVNTYEILEGHKDYVNSACYEPEGELLATASDDHTCKLWAVKEEEEDYEEEGGQRGEEQRKHASTFYLTSPGTIVRFHGEESGKLMVAEKNGLIRMYNVRTRQAIMSLDAGVVPLMSADWGSNPLRVVAIAGGELLIWDVSRPSRPVEYKTLYIEGGQIVKFSPAYEHLVATVGRPDNTMKVSDLKSGQPILSARLKLITGGISWHYKLPYICAGNDRELCFWRVNV